MKKLPIGLSYTRITRMIDNIGSVNENCTFQMPDDFMCHASIITNYVKAKEVVFNIMEHYKQRPAAGDTTFEVWMRKFDSDGLLVHIGIKAVNKEIEGFNPGSFGSLD